MIRKLGNYPLTPVSANAIQMTAIDLAARDPLSAIAALSQAENNEFPDSLIGAAATGISQSFTAEVASALNVVSPSTLLRLLLKSTALSEKALLQTNGVSLCLANALAAADTLVQDEAARRFLPLLVTEQHLGLAAILISRLGSDELLDEIRRLYDVDRLALPKFRAVLAKQVLQINGASTLRTAVAAIGRDGGVDQFLSLILQPNLDDISWLIEHFIFEHSRQVAVLTALLQRASASQLQDVLANEAFLEQVLSVLDDNEPSISVLREIVLSVPMRAGMYAESVLRLAGVVTIEQITDLVYLALSRCLRTNFIGKESAIITALINALGEAVNGRWLVRRGLERHVTSDIANRNLASFDVVQPIAKARLIWAVEDLGSTIQRRPMFDLSEQAIRICADIFLSAASSNPEGVLRASLQLLPYLLKARKRPVSPLIAATFQIVYQELRRGSEVPDLFRLFMFSDWDRCKTARVDLVDAFMSSTWRPVDLAIAAVRSDDAVRIFERVGRRDGGDEFLVAVERDLEAVPLSCRELVSVAIREARHRPTETSTE